MVSFSVAYDYSQSLLLSNTRLFKHLIAKKVPGICGLQIAYTAVPSALRFLWSSCCHVPLKAPF
ncbi:hypothetical protein PMIT1313_00245 [Prochlorococcus marinus str. MIT 1313]|nr:hypothetical protein PMIT1313_00245 [Prochlorococcus marinus str. MIT 1313]